MLLLVDAGNTNTVLGLSDPRLDSETLSSVWRVSSVRDRMADEWLAILAPLMATVSLPPVSISGMIVSSVVPAITTALRELGKRHFGVEPLVVSHHLDLGITVETDSPAEVGSDRLVNAAFGFAKYGGPTVIVDLGTATKLEAITGAGAFLGGVIAPGIGVTLDALASRAARLYSVELKVPSTTIGRNTISAVQSGVVSGHIAMINGMVERVSQELGGARNIVLTGGYGAVVRDEIDSVTMYEPDLTLLGLRYLFDRNRG